MASKKTTSNDILVKVDQNNLIYIDPNTVVSNGVIQQRQVEPENLVMYVNLEADLIPRTTLIAGDKSNNLISIAKGTLNFLQNTNGQNYDSTWTDAFTNITERKNSIDTLPSGVAGPVRPPEGTGEYGYEGSSQTFGIESINIQILGVNLVPRITIKFIDVRGKTLFESPSNSPYKAFFHLPWPIFYLSVKGYYGKAIKYRLHMIDFKSVYNSENGNFEIESTFVGSTYAYLTDIPLAGILNCPYMFGIEQAPESKFNENTGYYEKILKKTSLGYVTLKSVYDEYKSKGLLPQNFPVKTLREIAIIARRLNKILENEIFRQVVDPKVLAGVKEFEDLIQGLYKAVDIWKQKHLSGSYTTIGEEKLYKLSDAEKNSYKNITGQTSGTLEEIIINYTKQLEGNQSFGKNRDEKLMKKDGLKVQQISLNTIQNIKDFYTEADAKILIYYDRLVDRINNIRRDFIQQRTKLEQTLQDKMNEVVKDPAKGFGFEPTIRNIVGVVCANADTYIRLLKGVHTKAFNAAPERQKYLTGVPTDSNGNDNIYPWPEVKELAAGAKQNILVYPGASDMIKKLKSDDPTLWPEVAFVEEYNSVSTYKKDPLTEKEGTSDIVSYIFESNTDALSKTELSAFTFLTGDVPYYDKSITNVLYEIWERAKYVTQLETFDSNTIKELALLEFTNLQNQIGEDYETVEILKQQVTGTTALQLLMHGYSPFERWPYYESQLPTVSYITETSENDFGVEKSAVSEITTDNSGKYPNLTKALSDYRVEKYRTNIYPFNSGTYKSYLTSKTFGLKELDLPGILGLRTNGAFISSPIDPKQWVNGFVTDNMFNCDAGCLIINGFQRHILNTPYFHRQLLSDFNTSRINGKYASSAYLLLNSLPFKDLSDTIIYNGKEVLMSTMFREIGASHFIPYHLMIKWGSIYHRYKTYIMDGVDIISGITTPIDPDYLFDDYSGRTYNVGSYAVDRTSENNIGLYPFYQSIFHQIIHDYTFYNPTDSDAPTKYSDALTAGNIIDLEKQTLNNIGWTSFIDNSKYDKTQSGYTFLPSNGNYNYNDMKDYLASEQDNLRLLWNVEIYSNQIVSYSGETFPTYDQYFKSTGNTYSISANNRKVIDLIATFKPDILDVFEQAFLDFASQNLNDEIPYSPYGVKYGTFQELLKSLVYVKKESTDPTNDIPKLISTLVTKQNQNLVNVTTDILSTDSLIKVTLANPKEIDPYSLFGITGIDSKNFDVGEFSSGQVTQDNLDYIKLYLGEDMDGYYLNFFSANNIALNEDNIKNLRYLIYVYAGAKAGNAGVTDKASFISYLINNVINKQTESNGMIQRLRFFLETLISKFPDLKSLNTENKATISRGYNDDALKLESYNNFKAFNDKWVAGNSLGQKTLFEEFVFLDKANRDIGDEVYLSMDRLMTILDQHKLKNMNLYSTIVLLIQNSGFDLRVLPSYVNFYGANFSNTKKLTPSKNVAKNLFGTFLEVDYQDSVPKVVLQYTGPVSMHLELSDIDKDAKFKNDSFDMSDVNNNPIIVGPDIFRIVDYAKSNKAVAFEVSFGDQNQSIFKGLELNQATVKNTSQTFDIQEQLGNAETGSSTAQIDIGLYDIYRTASYACKVTAMGNVMIQPTMYFYLKNVPLFRGTYWITEVSHMIQNNTIETTFTGRRLALQSLPDPKDSFLASYRALFDQLTSQAVAKVHQDSLISSGITQYDKPYTDDKGVTYTVNMGPKQISGEELIKQAGIKPYGIPYNGFNDEKYIQLVKYRTKYNDEWLRATVVEMGGSKYPIQDSITMSIITLQHNPDLSQTQVNWGSIKDTTSTYSFYASRFDLGTVNPDDLLTKFGKTEFYNPQKNTHLILQSNVEASFDFTVKKANGPIHRGPGLDGIGMSKKLMKELDLYDGDVVYFRLTS